jgi:energy-converting hydrogenase Eha subunit E
LIFFSLIAELCFRKPTDYNTAFKAFKTLFYASLGDFSFDDISKSEKGEYFGITFMIIFLVCNIGIILNTFIAVIAVLYDTYSEKRNVY